MADVFSFHHQGLDYLNMAMAQVTDNPAIADGSSIHQEAKQQLHSYLRTNIQPLMRAGKQLDLKDILHHVTIRKPKLVQQLGMQQVQHMAVASWSIILLEGNWDVRFLIRDVRQQLPNGNFDLILRRNLIFTYFQQDLQSKLLEQIVRKLKPNVFFVLGVDESLKSSGGLLAPYLVKQPIYQKIKF